MPLSNQKRGVSTSLVNGSTETGISKAELNLKRSEEILQRLSESLGYFRDKPLEDRGKVRPGDLLDYITEKFHKLLYLLKREEDERIKIEEENFELKKNLHFELLKREETLIHNQQEMEILSQRYQTANEEPNPQNFESEKKDIIITNLESQKRTLKQTLEKEKAENEKKNLGLSQRLKENEHKAVDLENKLRELIIQNDALKLSVDEYKYKTSRLTEENLNLTQKNADYEVKLNDSRKAVFSVENESRGNLDQMRELLKKNSKLMRRLEECERDNSKLKEEIDSKNERLNVLRAANQKLEHKSNELFKKCQELEKVNKENSMQISPSKEKSGLTTGTLSSMEFLDPKREEALRKRIEEKDEQLRLSRDRIRVLERENIDYLKKKTKLEEDMFQLSQNSMLSNIKKDTQSVSSKLDSAQKSQRQEDSRQPGHKPGKNITFRADTPKSQVDDELRQGLDLYSLNENMGGYDKSYSYDYKNGDSKEDEFESVLAIKPLKLSFHEDKS